MMRPRAAAWMLLSALLAACFAGCGLSARELPYALTQHQVARVSSESMYPNNKAGDGVAIKVGYYDERPLQRFDVVAYKQRPENPMDIAGHEEPVYIGRVVGLGGEKVEFKDGKVFVDGRLLEEPYETAPYGPPDPQRDPGRPVVFVPAGEYLLLGDNRPNSYDGRYWDTPTLPKRYIHGKVVKIFPQQSAAQPAATP